MLYGMKVFNFYGYVKERMDVLALRCLMILLSETLYTPSRSSWSDFNVLLEIVPSLPFLSFSMPVRFFTNIDVC